MRARDTRRRWIWVRQWAETRKKRGEGIGLATESTKDMLARIWSAAAGWFSKPTPATTAAATNAAIQQMRQTVSDLEKRMAHLERQLADCRVRAKQCAQKGNKPGAPVSVARAPCSSPAGAIRALKQKKLYEARIEQVTAAIGSIEEQIMAIDHAHCTTEVVRTMQLGASTMKAMHTEAYDVVGSCTVGPYLTGAPSAQIRRPRRRGDGRRAGPDGRGERAERRHRAAVVGRRRRYGAAGR
jgi:hypothetical protein